MIDFPQLRHGLSSVSPALVLHFFLKTYFCYFKVIFYLLALSAAVVHEISQKSRIGSTVHLCGPCNWPTFYTSSGQ